jgi:hypothetical protein
MRTAVRPRAGMDIAPECVGQASPGPKPGSWCGRRAGVGARDRPDAPERDAGHEPGPPAARGVAHHTTRPVVSGPSRRLKQGFVILVAASGRQVTSRGRDVRAGVKKTVSRRGDDRDRCAGGPGVDQGVASGRNCTRMREGGQDRSCGPRPAAGRCRSHRNAAKRRKSARCWVGGQGHQDVRRSAERSKGRRAKAHAGDGESHTRGKPGPGRGEVPPPRASTSLR